MTFWTEMHIEKNKDRNKCHNITALGVTQATTSKFLGKEVKQPPKQIKCQTQRPETLKKLTLSSCLMRIKEIQWY